MRQLFLAVLTIPSVILWIGVSMGFFTDRTFFEVVGIPRFIGLIPILSLLISVGLVFVAPNTKEWKLAATVNTIPLLLIFLLALFFWVLGIDS